MMPTNDNRPEDPQEDKATEALFIDKDQADALLIILTQQHNLLSVMIENYDVKRGMSILTEYMPEASDEDLKKIVEEQHALDISILATIPGILSEIKDIYPMLQGSTEKKSRIEIIKPTWKNK